MPHKAFQRLFLILFPLFLSALALFLIHISPPETQNFSPKSSDQSSCEFNAPLLAVSFFPKPSPIKAKVPSLQRSYLLSQKSFLKQISLAQPHKAFIFVLPVLLNGEEDWLISEKVFFISASGERKEISQLSQAEIQSFHKDFKVLTLEQVLKFLPPKSHFLLQILGSDRQKILKNLSKIRQKITGDLFLSSPDEHLIEELIRLKSLKAPSEKPRSKNLPAKAIPAQSPQPEKAQTPKPQPENLQAFQVIHSFKSLIRSQILSFLPAKKLWAEGVWVPASIAGVKFDSLRRFEKENKKIFIEKEPPYSEEDLKASASYIFISSQPKRALIRVKNKKTCFSPF